MTGQMRGDNSCFRRSQRFGPVLEFALFPREGWPAAAACQLLRHGAPQGSTCVWTYQGPAALGLLP